MATLILGSLMQVPLFFVNTVTDAAALLFARGADFPVTLRQAAARRLRHAAPQPASPA
jgi:hypothetical protein